MKNAGRTLRRLTAALAVVFSLCCAQPVQAQSSGGFSDSGSYQFTIPGYVGSNGGSTTLFDASFNAGGGFDLGCGGIGLFDFIKTTFNLNNIMTQFKASMQTMLAKTLLTQLMSVPQIAALFDTLNAFGNARFDLFQQSCNIGEIKQEAKQLCIDRCVARGIAPDLCRDEECNNSGGILGDVTAELRKKLIENENLSNALRGDFCKDDDGAYNPRKSDSCFIMALLPQMRLCLRSSIGEKCEPSEGYGTKDSPISVASMWDTSQRAAMALFGTQQAFYGSASHAALPQSTKGEAARRTIVRAAKGDKASRLPRESSNNDEATDRLIKDFRNFAQCSEDTQQAMNIPLLYEEELRKLTSAALPTMSTEIRMDEVIEMYGPELVGDLRDVYGQDLKGLKEVLKISTGCNLNRLGAVSPFVWNTSTSLGQDAADNFVQSLGEEVGYRVAIEVARFTKSWVAGKKALVSLDQQTRPPGAANAEQEEDGESEYTAENQIENPKILPEIKKQAIDDIVAKLETYITTTETLYQQKKEARKGYCRAAAMANSMSWDNGTTQPNLLCGD